MRKLDIQSKMGFRDIPVMAVALPVIAFLLNFFFFENRNLGSREFWWLYFNFLCLITLITAGNRYILFHVRSFLKWRTFFLRRVLIELALTNIFSLTLINLVVYFGEKYLFTSLYTDQRHSRSDMYLTSNFSGILLNMAVILVYNIFYQIRELKTSIEESVTVKHNKMLTDIMLHDIKSPMRFLSEVSGSLYNNWEKYDDAFRKELAGEILKASFSLNEFINRYLLWLRVRVSGDIAQTHIDLESLLKKLVRNHSVLLNKDQVTVNVQCPPGIQVVSKEIYLEIILNNIIENACKYTSKGYVTVSVWNEKNAIKIQCMDTGVGIDEEMLQKIKTGQELFPDETGKNSFTFGFTFITKLMPEVNGEFQIESEVGKGTTVVLSLPFN